MLSLSSLLRRAALTLVLAIAAACSIGAGLATADTVTSDPSYVSNDGNLCVKGRFAFNFVHHPDRLTEPLIRGDDGELHPATWDEALAAASEGLSLVRDRYGPQAIAFLASARLTNEENYLIQKLARGVVGTNSVHSCEAT